VAIGDEPIDVVFLLLLPETGDGAQLNALAGIAGGQRRCGASGMARDSEALYRAIAKPDTV
jgi:hypothetical protein